MTTSTDIHLLPTPGQLIADRYEVVEVVGRGGGGVVYRATQVGTGRDVALKVLPPEHQLHATAVRRFEREARLVSRLSHPNTVTVHELIRTPSGLLCIAMEYVEGVPLKTVLEQTGRVPPGRAVPILRQICKSLAEAHAGGIVHRDLKPANIMLCNMHTERDFVKVLDFGVATALDDDTGYAEDVTRSADVVGTPKYMAPEQFRAGPISPASDLYSLGCIAFEMLSGYCPFDGETLHVTIAKHLFQPPPTLPEFLNLYPALVDLVHQLLQKAPGERLPTAEAVLSALVSWEDGADATVVGVPAMLDEDLVPYDELRPPQPAAAPPNERTGPGPGGTSGNTFPGYTSSHTPSHVPTPNPSHTPHNLVLPDASSMSLDTGTTDTRRWLLVGVVGVLTLAAFVTFVLVRFGGDDDAERASANSEIEAPEPVPDLVGTAGTEAAPLPELGDEVTAEIERAGKLQLVASRTRRGAIVGSLHGARLHPATEPAVVDDEPARDDASEAADSALDAQGRVRFRVRYEPPMAAVTVTGAASHDCKKGTCRIKALPGSDVSIRFLSMGYQPEMRAFSVEADMRRRHRVRMKPAR